jgi:hypothetical protein
MEDSRNKQDPTDVSTDSGTLSNALRPLGKNGPREYAQQLQDAEQVEQQFRHIESLFATVYTRVLNLAEKVSLHKSEWQMTSTVTTRSTSR